MARVVTLGPRILWLPRCIRYNHIIHHIRIQFTPQLVVLQHPYSVC